jgi:hypothetical protein
VSTGPFTDPLVEKIAAFLRGIGLPVQHGTLDGTAFLPGLTLDAGRIIIDETKLLYPGDVLHEAGHLAVTPAAERATCGGKLTGGGGEEMGAIAWSYAAALHIGIDPAIVFHEHGYRSGSDSLLENFREGRFLAVPLLQWMGLTCEEKNAAARGCAPYPHILRWLRE